MTTPNLTNYNPFDIVGYFNGILIDGYAKDSSFTVEDVAEQRFVDEVGLDGQVTRSRVEDARVKITVDLMQSSATNDAFSSVLNTDLNAPNGAGVGTFQFEDTSGRAVASGNQAWLAGYPKAGYGKSADTITWVIMIANGRRFQGGNT